MLPIGDYEALVEAADEVAATAAVNAFHADRPETFPAELVARLVDGESPLKVFREYRGLTVERLAELTDISPATILAIETGTETAAPSPPPPPPCPASPPR